MAKETKIAWTDHTFNPWMGCTKVSSGCKYCYAELLVSGRMGIKSAWGNNGKRVITSSPWKNVKTWDSEAERDQVIRKVFIGSLMDWAEDRNEIENTRKLMWSLIRNSKNLVFQLLTKRPENISKFLPQDWGEGYDNVWLGTSIESDQYAYRVKDLIANKAKVHFISYEPAVGPLETVCLDHIEWVIYGGESGPNFRQEDKAWARSMMKRCKEKGIAFFHKQSAARFTDMGIELDGIVIREYP